MTTIPHRELRNNSAQILRRVEAGESFEISNHGTVVAVISPKRRSRLEQLRVEGKVREATVGRVDFSKIPLVEGESTQDILDDIRRPW
jgi:prevent-host-death family protein